MIAADIIPLHEIIFEFMGMWDRGIPSLAANLSYSDYGSHRKLHKKGKNSEGSSSISNIKHFHPVNNYIITDNLIS